MTEPVTISKAHFAALLRRYDCSTTQGCMKDYMSQLTLRKIRARLVRLSQTRNYESDMFKAHNGNLRRLLPDLRSTGLRSDTTGRT